ACRAACRRSNLQPRERAAALSLPRRGRVGAKRRGGVCLLAAAPPRRPLRSRPPSPRGGGAGGCARARGGIRCGHLNPRGRRRYDAAHVVHPTSSNKSRRARARGTFSTELSFCCRLAAGRVRAWFATAATLLRKPARATRREATHEWFDLSDRPDRR